MLRRSYPASSPSGRPLGRPELRAPGPRVPIDLRLRRHHRALRPNADDAGRCNARNVCFTAILERVKRQHHQPPAGASRSAARVRNPSSPSSSWLTQIRIAWKVRVAGSIRVYPARNRPPHDVRQLPGRLDAPRLSRFHDRARHATRVTLFAQLVDHVCQSFSSTEASISAAVIPLDVSMRMSRGSSRLKLNPRPGASSCNDDTPRSASIRRPVRCRVRRAPPRIRDSRRARRPRPHPHRARLACVLERVLIAVEPNDPRGACFDERAHVRPTPRCNPRRLRPAMAQDARAPRRP